MTDAGFLALDWGTTHLRAWRVDAAGVAGPRRDFPLGVSKLAAGEAAARFESDVRPAMDAEALPALAAGMIGSTLGWIEAPYVDCPADAAALASGLASAPSAGAHVDIVPGLRCARDGAPDVMRGEETQVLGWIAANPAHASGRWLVCHPGTHAKWIEVVDGRVVRFATVMTGELFALLSTHSVLKSDPEAASDPGDVAFDQGVRAAGDGGALSSRLFSTRSRVVGGDLAPAAARAYLSGLLIGADVAAAPALLGFGAETPVALIGEPALTRSYARALTARGASCTSFDGDAAVLAGLVALHRTREGRR